MITELIAIGDRVVYVPDQNKGDNIHHDAVIVAKARRHNFYLIDVIGGKPTRVHRKRLLVGQLDAFQTDQV